MNPDHTCHTNCPCHTGGQPAADFIDAADGPSPTTTKEHRMTQDHADESPTTPSTIVMCTAPEGPHEHIEMRDEKDATSCFNDCDCTPRVYVAVDALLSDAAVNAASADNGSGAQCGVEEYGGCGGTHTNCYYRSKLRAAIQAVGGGKP